MARLKDKKAALTQLFEIVQKEAGLAQTDISGEPGKDTNVSSVSESTETTNQNAVGPEELNGKQGPEQHAASGDSAIPLAQAKQASEDINKAAQSILDAIRENIKEAKAQTDISGKPGKDTNITSVSDSTETTNQNAVGPEELNGKQGPEQKGSDDKSAPLKTASDLGKAFFSALQKRAHEVKEVTKQQEHVLMCKAAGRADLETLVQHALVELENQKQAQAVEEARIAEKQGSDYFDEIYKQAAYQYAQEQKEQALYEKIASLESKLASIQPVTSTQDEQVKTANVIANAIVEQLKLAQAAK